MSNENTHGAIAYCLDPTDLAIAKHVAGRDKDIEFTAAMVVHGMVDAEAFMKRLEHTDIPDEHREHIRQRFEGQLAAAARRAPEDHGYTPG